MREIAWIEINSKYRLVTKRKTFKSEAAAQKFIQKLIQKDNFHSIIATR